MPDESRSPRTEGRAEEAQDGPEDAARRAYPTPGPRRSRPQQYTDFALI